MDILNLQNSNKALECIIQLVNPSQFGRCWPVLVPGEKEQALFSGPESYMPEHGTRTAKYLKEARHFDSDMLEVS